MRTPEATHRDTLIYIEQMLHELGKLANQAEYAFLAHIIDMALIEARDLIKIPIRN